MAETYTVKYLIEILRKNIMSKEEQDICKSLDLLDSKGKLNNEKMGILKANEKKLYNAIVILKEDGTLKLVEREEEEEETTASSSAVKGKGKEEETIADFEFSKENIEKILQGKVISIDNNRMKKVLEDYVMSMPKTASTYQHGSVIVRKFKGIELGVSSLLSAGTKILDALLFMAYGNSLDHNFIFDVSEISPKKISSKELIENIDLGNKAIKAAFCMVFNQGGLPQRTSEPRNLSKFIRETIFDKKDLSSNDLCDHMSTSSPSFFPSAIFLDVDLANLPAEVSSRCKMSVAGNKALRYAVASQKFEKNFVEKPSGTDEASVYAYMELKDTLSKARSFVNRLCSLASEFESQKRMHPLYPKKVSRKNFTLQLTRAVVYSLSVKGREDMRAMIDSKKIESFKRDENIYGIENHLREIVFPVLTNPDADFKELSIEAIDAVYRGE